jgi:hypothetical protein
VPWVGGGQGFMFPSAHVERLLRFWAALPPEPWESCCPAAYKEHDGTGKLILKLKDWVMCVDLSNGQSMPLNLAIPCK